MMNGLIGSTAGKTALALLIATSALTPTMVFHADEASAAVAFAGGTGTVSDPYLIETGEQLHSIRNYGAKATHFKLVKDIDLTDVMWSPIENFYTGSTIDGNNHTISNMKIRSTVYMTGFIKRLTGGVKNLTFKNADVISTQMTTGVLAGDSSKEASVENVHIVGGSVKGTNNVGGIVGSMSGPVNNSSSDVPVEGANYVGGLIGTLNGGGAIVTNSHATGNVAGVGATAQQAGGLIGLLQGGQLIGSYATGNVVGNEIVGGLVGQYSSWKTNLIQGSYSTGNVTGANRVGGAVGFIIGDGNEAGPSIKDVFTTGDVWAKSGIAGAFTVWQGETRKLLKIHNVYSLGQVQGTQKAMVYNMNPGSLNPINHLELNHVLYMGDSKISVVNSEYKLQNSALFIKDSSKIDNIGSPVVLTSENAMKKATYVNTDWDTGFDFTGRPGGFAEEPKNPDWGIDEGLSLPYLLNMPHRLTYDSASGGWVLKEVGSGGGGALPDGSDDGSGTNQNATLLLNGGSLTLDVPAITPMGLIKLTPQAQKVTTGFTDTFGVSDARGTGEGWRLAVNATPFEVVEPDAGFAPGTSANKLPAGTLTLKPLASIERLGTGVGTDPASKLPMDSIIDSGAVTVANANVNEGMGDFKLSFAEDALGLIIDSATAKIDKVNYPDTSTPYESTVTWTLVTGP